MKLKVVAYVAISLCLILCTKHLLRPRIKEGFYRAYTIFVVSYAVAYLSLPFHLMVHLYLFIIGINKLRAVPAFDCQEGGQRADGSGHIYLAVGGCGFLQHYRKRNFKVSVF